MRQKAVALFDISLNGGISNRRIPLHATIGG